MLTEISTNIYPFVQSPDSGEWRIDITPNGKKVRRTIYEIWTQNGPYIGRTEGSFGKRMSNHLKLLRSDTSTKVYRVIKKALENGHPVFTRILEVVPPSEDIRMRESHWIAEQDSVRNGLNSNRGSMNPVKKIEKPDTPYIPPTDITPQKKYPLKRKAGRVCAPLTASVKKVKSAIYRIKNIKTGKRYVGQTIQFPQRTSQHISDANTRRSRKRLHKEMREHPENFTIGVIQEVHPAHLDEAEKHLIEATGSYRNGYNGNRGKKPKLLPLKLASLF